MAANQSTPGLNRGLSSNFWQQRCSNHVKFTEEYVMCMEWRSMFLVKKMLTNGLNCLKMVEIDEDRLDRPTMARTPEIS